MTTPMVREGIEAAGINSILPKEHGAKFFVLPVVKTSDSGTSCIASWDSSIHDSLHLNRLTPANERVYLILKVSIAATHARQRARLPHPQGTHSRSRPPTSASTSSSRYAQRIIFR